jgi:hypothetical protein
MKYLILLLFLTPGLAVPCTCQCGPLGPVKTLMSLKRYLEPRLAPGAIPATILAPAIRKASTKFGVDERTVASVLILESRGLPNAISKTHDFGIMQINSSHGLSKKCLKDWHCNLNFGVFLLAHTTRPCEYNLGPKGKFHRYKSLCELYERKLALKEK